MEKWKDIKGFEGCYKISNKGRVKSLSRIRNKGKAIIKERILKKRYDKRGYVQYILYKNGQKFSVKEHHLVYDAFNKGKRKGRELNIDHVNGIRDDNRPENLQLTTNRENLAKGKKGKTSKYTGVYKPKNSEKYQAYITINKKHYFLGSFDTEEEAHEEYLKNIPECEKQLKNI